jgi:hypothetical protein
MKNNKRLIQNAQVSTLLLAMSCGVLAHAHNCDEPINSGSLTEEQTQHVSEPLVPDVAVRTSDQQEAIGPDQAGEAPTIIELSDKVHQLAKTLESDTAVHVFNFTSVRGQDVLLGTPDRETFNKLWKVQYQIGSGEWKVKTNTNPLAFKNLKPGVVITARVSAVEGAKFDSAPYTLVFGSYPLRTFDLASQEGFVRIPNGYSEPSYLATQAQKSALLKTHFRDTTGAPLEGGVLKLSLWFSSSKSEVFVLESGSDGNASRLLEFNSCEGGALADNFRHRQGKVTNIWATRYNVGSYEGKNYLLDDLADPPHSYSFGHICRRFLYNRIHH